MENANTKAILEYSPEYLPKESEDEQTFFVESFGTVCLNSDEYIIDHLTAHNLIKIIKK